VIFSRVRIRQKRMRIRTTVDQADYKLLEIQSTGGLCHGGSYTYILNTMGCNITFSTADISCKWANWEILRKQHWVLYEQMTQMGKDREKWRAKNALHSNYLSFSTLLEYFKLAAIVFFSLLKKFLLLPPNNWASIDCTSQRVIWKRRKYYRLAVTVQ
jgi:hypothetical protein